MNTLRSVFWNDYEGRFRAGYRIVLQLATFFAVWNGLRFLVGSIPGAPAEIASDTPLWFFLILGIIRLLRVLVSVWLVGRFLDRRPFKNFGLRIRKGWWTDLGFGLGLGVLLMGMLFAIELAAGWVTITETLRVASPERSFVLSILVFLFVFLCVGFSEELFYRGYHLTNLAEGLNFKSRGPKYAIVFALALSSVLFGAFHLGGPDANLLGELNIVLWGILFGISYAVTGRLGIPVGIHVAWNFLQGNVFGLPVSGATFPAGAVTFIATDQRGPELWTGGPFGPEAGLLCSCALVVGVLLTVGWVRLRYGRLRLHVPSAQSPSMK